jgi:V8-like Glu-specific endopeptidase
MLTLGLLGWVAVGQATAQLPNDATHATIGQHGNVTVLTVPSPVAPGGVGIDFVHAQAMKLPSIARRSDAEVQRDLIDTFTSQVWLGEPGYAAGEIGNGVMNLIRLGVPRASGAHVDEIAPQEIGVNNHPFSTARADLDPVSTNTSYPYRASGKLFFNHGTDTFVCSASLIKRGVVVTAAHCVADYGKSQYYSNWQFVPGYRNGSAPYGVWTVQTAYVLTAYYNGTDPCAQDGVVCQDDVAILLLNASAAGAYPGTATGWYSYGWNGYGFTGSGLTQITQIGYPLCLDNGAYMERNDSHGYTSASNANNTLIGSLMCGGSSGGPWLVNFGIRPSLTGTTAGTAPDANIVVGVTSWGSTNPSPKEQGASPFLSSNIVPLVNIACTAVQAACS